MAVLKVSCDQVVDFLEQNRFEFMKSLRDLNFYDDAVEFKYKTPLGGLLLKIELLSFEKGILRLKVDSKDMRWKLANTFAGLKGIIDSAIEENNLTRFVKREEAKQLYFQVLLNDIISAWVKGIVIENIRLKDRQFIIDF